MPSGADFEEFQEYYVEAKERTDERITEVLENKEEFATKRKLLAHSTSGGKRIRPVLTLLVSEVYDSPFDSAINHAAIVELIHNASLISDDRYDEDAMRRGSPTLHAVIDRLPFGKSGHKAITGMSVMGANGLVGLAMELAKDPDVLNAMGQGTRKLVDGFFHEGLNVFDGVVGGGYDKYIEINRAKTGGLFALAAWMPATHVDAPEEQEMAARKYGETVGILYQIADDIADDDLPSYVTDPEEELTKWYDKAVEYVDEMPPDEKKDLLRVAPAWMVWRMFSQEDIIGEVEPAFLQNAPEA
jgi:geranylgeranyl diphosphate synthase type I